MRFKYCPYGYICKNGEDCKKRYKHSIISKDKTIEYFTQKPMCFEESEKKIKKDEKDLTNDW